MAGKVNYIRHLQAVVEKFNLDDRLSPWHISLYHALFHSWNDNLLENPVSINRNELMRLSKIGSANTYTKTLKELSQWEYLRYEPSKNRWVGSKIYMYRFDTSTDNSRDTTTDKSSDKTAVTPVIKQVRPSIKGIKKIKVNKGLKVEKGKTSFAIPALDEVKIFFSENASTETEAESFFNHFQSNGWLVGGKAKMKDWNAAARNWIKRSAQFKSNDRSLSLSKNRLNTNNDKDYSIPL